MATPMKQHRLFKGAKRPRRSLNDLWKQYDMPLKLLLIGHGDGGKTSFLNRYADGVFKNTFATIGKA